MKTILLTNRYTGAPLEIVEGELPAGFALEFLERQDHDCLVAQARDADYILAGGRMKLTADVLDNAPRLKMIQRSGVGLDALDLDAIRAHGIPLYVNQGVNAQSGAEHTLMLILACLRRLTVIHANTRSGIWKKQEQGVQTAELRGKTVGIVGMGNIAKALVALLKPFGVSILYCNLVREPAAFEEENRMEFVPLDDLLARSDIVTIHCALTDATRNLVGADAIARMKDGSILVNTARGQIVDVQALAAALRGGKLAFAGIDAHVQEPIPDDYPLKALDNAILTPHIAGVTGDSFRAMMHGAFTNIALFDAGRTDEIARFRYI
jgi:D-3-phosphoglycerate dehydrogenase